MALADADDDEIFAIAERHGYTPALAVVRGDNRPLRARRNLPRAASPRPALSASSDTPSRQGDRARRRKWLAGR